MALNMRPSGLVLEEKRILAWYDTTPVYIVLVLFALATAVFSRIGIKAAQDIHRYAEYVWVPKLLLVLSLVLMLLCGSRLLYRLVITVQDRDY